MASSPATVLFVARDADGRIVGSLTLAVFRIPTGVRAWIEDVVVDGQVRGRESAASSCELLWTRAAAMGARTVDLTSQSVPCRRQPSLRAPRIRAPRDERLPLQLRRRLNHLPRRRAKVIGAHRDPGSSEIASGCAWTGPGLVTMSGPEKGGGPTEQTIWDPGGGWPLSRLAGPPGESQPVTR